jgi:acetyl esterase/lipase
MRRIAASLLPLTVVASLLSWPASAQAATGCPLAMTASQISPAGLPAFTMCTGSIPSFDGTPLDSDLSLPPSGTAKNLPLIVMLNGWGDSKTQFEATSYAGNRTDSYDWNNTWFAEHGFAVLNYTARGFWDSCGKNPDTGYSYLTDSACSGQTVNGVTEASWTHLSDLRWEIHDTQYLVGRLVDAGIANPDKIVVTGDSYGGGQSWLLALAQNKVMSPNGVLTPWTSPHGVPIHLAAAIPQYPWTDLAEALVDNGRASDGADGAPTQASHTNPIGVEKQSYVDGLYGLGTAYAQYSTTDPTADLPAWFTAISAGEPYSADPLVASALTQLTTYRSAYYQPIPRPAEQVPVLDLQGLTDPLFPAVQALQMQQRLTAAYPDYPLWVVLGDLGHAYAANPPALWATINGLANNWLDSVLAGQTPTLARDTEFPVSCTATPAYYPPISGAAPAGLANTIETFTGTGTATTTSAAVTGPEAETVDPIINGSVAAGGCRSMSVTTDPGVAAWTFTPKHTGFISGTPTVHVTVGMTGTDAELAARLWQIDPTTGVQTLVTRAIYRLSSTSPTSTQQVAIPLWPTAWPLIAGDQLKLELTQGDDPTWRADNLPSTLSLSGVSLTVPERATGTVPPAANPAGAGRSSASGTPAGTTAATASLPDTGGEPQWAWTGLLLLAAAGLAGRAIRRRRGAGAPGRR